MGVAGKLQAASQREAIGMRHLLFDGRKCDESLRL